MWLFWMAISLSIFAASYSLMAHRDISSRARSAIVAESVDMKTHSPPPTTDIMDPSNIKLGEIVDEKYPMPKIQPYMRVNPRKFKTSTRRLWPRSDNIPNGIAARISNRDI